VFVYDRSVFLKCRAASSVATPRCPRDRRSRRRLAANAPRFDGKRPRVLVSPFRRSQTFRPL
jgi:hypothetical protein